MFGIRQKPSSPTSSLYDKFEAKLMLAIYSIMHEVIQHQIKSRLLFIALMIVESGQFMWYAIHPNFPFLWSTGISVYVRDTFMYLQVDYVLRQSYSNFFYPLLFATFAFQMIMIGIVTLTLLKLGKAKKKTSATFFYTVRILGYYALLLKTIAPLPLFNIFLTAIFCNGYSLSSGMGNCLQGLNLGCLILGVIGNIVTFVFSLIAELYCIDLNPYSASPFAATLSNITIAKLCLKFVLPLYIVLDTSMSWCIEFIIAYTISWFIILVMRYWSQGYYDKFVTIFAAGLDGILFWAALVSSFHVFVANSNIDDAGCYYLLFGAPFVGYTYYAIFARQKMLVGKRDTRKLKSSRRVELYFNYINFLIDNQAVTTDRVQLDGIIRNHVKFCDRQDDGCPCRRIAMYVAKEGQGVADKKELYKFINSILLERLIYLRKSSKLHLLYAYFQHDKMENKFKALHELTLTEESKPCHREEFSIFRYRNIIEKEMVEDDIRRTDSRGIDVKHIVQFQEKFVSFQDEIGKAVSLQLSFWKELEHNNPSVQNLLSLGSKITVQADVVKSCYLQLGVMNPNHIKTLKIYGNFLQEIMSDSVEAQRTLEKATYLEKSLLTNHHIGDSDRFKYSENTNTCVMTCSGELRSIGKILNTNSEVTRLFQYSASEMIGKNVCNLMPNIVAEVHDELMMTYFTTTKETSIGKEVLVFPVNKASYLVPCTIFTKIFPNLSEGLKIVAFLKDISENVKKIRHFEEDIWDNKAHYVMFGGESNIVYGVSESCFKSFGIPAELVSGIYRNFDEFTIDMIFPDILAQDKAELKTAMGLDITIDTTSLPQNFVMMRDAFKDFEEDEEAMAKRYRRSKVRAVIVLDEFYLEKSRVQVIKFTEHTEEGRKSVKFRGASMIRDNLKTMVDTESIMDLIEDKSRSDPSSSLDLIQDEGLRQLKDMKVQISGKQTPRSIVSLRIASIAFATGLIILVCIQLTKKVSINKELNQGLYSTRMGYQRDEILAEVNYQIRMLDLLSKNMLQYDGQQSDYESSIREQIATLITNLNNIHFQILQNSIAIVQSTQKQTFYLDYIIKSLLKDGSIATMTMIWYKTIPAFIAQAQQLSAVALSDIEGAGLQYLYYLQTNGLGPVRAGSEYSSQAFYDYYYNQPDIFSKFLLITMIVAIIILVLMQLFVIPKIFTVSRTNMKVLSLFGYIPPTEVHELAETCQQYLKTYLDEVKERRSSYLEEFDSRSENLKEGFKLTETSLPGLKNENLQTFEGFDRSPTNKRLNMQNKLLSTDHDFDQSKATLHTTQNGATRELKPLMRKMTNLEVQKEAEKEDEQLNYLYVRSQKLERSKVHNKGTVIVQIMSFAILFIAYFVFDYVEEQGFLHDYQNGINHLRVISAIIPNLRYTVTFALEELAVNDLSTVYPDLPLATVASNNYRTQHIDNADYNQISIKSTSSANLPSVFNAYLAELINYDNNNVCQIYFGVNSTMDDDCSEVANGVITNGLVQSEVTLIQNTIEVLSAFYAISNRDNQTQVDFINGNRFQDSVKIMDVIIPMLTSLVDDYMGYTSLYFQRVYNIQRIKFGVFIIVLLLLLIIVWIPYLARLAQQIFRTKGLLNMIPMTILQKNKSLRENFTSNAILNAVK